MVHTRIRLSELEIWTCVGLGSRERRAPQALLCSIDAWMHSGFEPDEDRIDRTVDYAELSRLLRREAARLRCHLLERLAYELSRSVFEKYECLTAISIELVKPRRIPRSGGASVLLEVDRAASAKPSLGIRKPVDAVQ